MSRNAQHIPVRVIQASSVVEMEVSYHFTMIQPNIALALEASWETIHHHQLLLALVITCILAVIQITQAHEHLAEVMLEMVIPIPSKVVLRLAKAQHILVLSLLVNASVGTHSKISRH